ncbi:hypothetical protein, partial [Endozoicomonas sp. ONNA1]|uniref:hypothetical protein n=1 Tax=Endozoicomonas sp. ONNA1 TaxID=2828740 RepID=UPI002147D435
PGPQLTMRRMMTGQVTFEPMKQKENASAELSAVRQLGSDSYSSHETDQIVCFRVMGELY